MDFGWRYKLAAERLEVGGKCTANLAYVVYTVESLNYRYLAIDPVFGHDTGTTRVISLRSPLVSLGLAE